MKENLRSVNDSAPCGSDASLGASLSPEAGLEVIVIDTGAPRTLAAVRAAGTLARGLNAAIHILVPQIVPYPLPLDRPPVARECRERKLRAGLSDWPARTKVSICLCRDESALLDVLLPGSIVVVGAEKPRWWRGERRLTQMLHGRGHQVVVAECR